jgi:endonuclease/exonuclease/phosphatase family metal-dependent hydrolase
VQRALGRSLPNRTHHKTFPAWWPVLALDRIYCRPGNLLVRSWTDPLARHASDHLPLIADIDMGAPGM